MGHGIKNLCHKTGEESQANQARQAEPTGVTGVQAADHGADRLYLASVAERLHNQPMQLVSAARICLFQIEQHSNGTCKAELLKQADSLLSKSLVELRRLMHDAQPPGLLKKTFSGSVHETTLELKAAFGIDCDLVASGLNAPVTPHAIDLAVRVIREAVINAYKHANTKQVGVEIVVDRLGLRLTVSNSPLLEAVDQPKEIKGGFGLFMLSRRAESMGGYLKLHVSKSHLVDTECELVLPRSSTYELSEQSERP